MGKQPERMRKRKKQAALGQDSLVRWHKQLAHVLPVCVEWFRCERNINLMMYLSKEICKFAMTLFNCNILCNIYTTKNKLK